MARQGRTRPRSAGGSADRRAGPGWVLVCSDGLWNYASEPDDLIAQIQKAGTTDPAELALALVDFANASGGVDNITATLARLESGQNAADTATAATETKTEGESDG